MDDRQKYFVRKTPQLSRKIVERAFDKTASPRQAIKAKCLACCNFDRDEVEFCTTVLCPLHAYRPYQDAPRKSGARPVKGFGDTSGDFDTQARI